MRSGPIPKHKPKPATHDDLDAVAEGALDAARAHFVEHFGFPSEGVANVLADPITVSRATRNCGDRRSASPLSSTTQRRRQIASRQMPVTTRSSLWQDTRPIVSFNSTKTSPPRLVFGGYNVSSRACALI